MNKSQHAYIDPLASCNAIVQLQQNMLDEQHRLINDQHQLIMNLLEVKANLTSKLMTVLRSQLDRLRSELANPDADLELIKKAYPMAWELHNELKVDDYELS